MTLKNFPDPDALVPLKLRRPTGLAATPVRLEKSVISDPYAPFVEVCSTLNAAEVAVPVLMSRGEAGAVVPMPTFRLIGRAFVHYLIHLGK